MRPTRSEESPAGNQTDGPPATSVVVRHLHVGALATYRRLPFWLKRMIAGWQTPSFQVAAGAVVQRADGALLLVRHSYRSGWGLAGGFLKRKEHPGTAVKREAFEELGIEIDTEGEPVVIIIPEDRRILVAFRARLVAGEQSAGPVPRSPEIAEARWFPLDDLPKLHREVARAVGELGIHPRR
ncbi:MAG: NUDIX domain-containing protein [Actinomycetota bacterium]|nr:NUDIX domain-containing protein [Actinomycetota bacterium]